MEIVEKTIKDNINSFLIQKRREIKAVMFQRQMPELFGGDGDSCVNKVIR